jgi:hypothetical protein
MFDEPEGGEDTKELGQLRAGISQIGHVSVAGAAIRNETDKAQRTADLVGGSHSPSRLWLLLAGLHVTQRHFDAIVLYRYVKT